jgi:hypothetical protein
VDLGSGSIDGYTTLPLHFGRGVDQFVFSNVLMQPNDFDGKRVRIAVKVLP